MDNPEKTEGAIKNGQSRETGNMFFLLLYISCSILRSTYLIDITKDKLDKNIK